MRSCELISRRQTDSETEREWERYRVGREYIIKRCAPAAIAVRAPPCGGITKVPNYSKQFQTFVALPPNELPAVFTARWISNSLSRVVVVVTLGNEGKWKSAWAYLKNRHIPTPTCLFLGLSIVITSIIVIISLAFHGIALFRFSVFGFCFSFAFCFIAQIVQFGAFPYSCLTPRHAPHSAQRTFHCNFLFLFLLYLFVPIICGILGCALFCNCCHLSLLFQFPFLLPPVPLPPLQS